METKARSPHLARSLEDRRLAGVAGGLGPYLSVDPDWIRLGFALSTLVWGVGLVVYAVLWVALPEAGEGEEGEEIRPPMATGNPQGTAGILLLALGLLLLLWKIIAWLSFKLVLPVILIALGIFLLRRTPR